MNFRHNIDAGSRHRRLLAVDCRLQSPPARDLAIPAGKPRPLRVRIGMRV